MRDEGTLLRLALEGSEVDCVAQLGLKRHQVVQRALRLVDDPAVAAEHPELVARFRAHRDKSRMKRTASLLQR